MKKPSESQIRGQVVEYLGQVCYLVSCLNDNNVTKYVKDVLTGATQTGKTRLSNLEKIVGAILPDFESSARLGESDNGNNNYRR